MTLADAGTATATEMATALGITPDAGSLFDDQNALSQALAGRAATAYQHVEDTAEDASVADYSVTVVNSLWGQKDLPWAPPFLSTLAQSYGIGVYEEDFANNASQALSDINDWVSTETGGRIYPLLSTADISNTTALVLVNAVDVKFPWLGAAFPVSSTVETSFTRGDGSHVTANMMFGGEPPGGFLYTDTSAATLVALPLADKQLQFVVALPKTDIASFISQLTPTAWAATWSALTSGAPQVNGDLAELELELPRFKFTTSSFSLKPALQSLGMNLAFTGSADFSPMCPTTSCPPLFISDVVQRAMIAVDEHGVKAAAATAVVMSAGATDGPAPPPPPVITVNVDHAFVFVIVDTSGAILFVGHVTDPTAT